MVPDIGIGAIAARRQPDESVTSRAIPRVATSPYTYAGLPLLAIRNVINVSPRIEAVFASSTAENNGDVPGCHNPAPGVA